MLGNFAEAVADYSAAIRLGLDEADLYYNRGMARANLSQYQLAIDDYSEAIRRNPNDAEFYFNRLLARRERGATADAELDLARANELEPGIMERLGLAE